ncbi:hypothetical protein CF327_g3970 [Tilletia walkeri]|nr:hypothetical protein CF327_g3970 [Tilletia walkeri]
MDGEEVESHVSDNELENLSDDGSEDEEIATEQLDAAKAAKKAASAANNPDGDNKDDPNKTEKKPKLSEDERRKAQNIYGSRLPFETESLEDYDERLENIIQRLTECIETKDWSVGFAHWHHRLQCLLTLKYPMRRRTRYNLARLFYELTVMPNLPRWITSLAATKFMSLSSDRSIYRLQLRWKPLFQAIEPFLAPKSRAVSLGSGIGAAATGSGATDTTRTGILLKLAHHANFYFVSEASYARYRALEEAKDGEEVPPLDENAPDIVDEMLDTFLPLMDGSDLDSVIRVQSLLVHFLPVSHPRKWLPAMFRLWESFNSSLFTDQMLDLLARLSVHHITNPKMSSDKSWKFRNGDWVDHVREAEAKRAAKLLEEEKVKAAAAGANGGTASGEGDVVMGDANDKLKSGGAEAESESTSYDTDAEDDFDDSTTVDGDETTAGDADEPGQSTGTAAASQEGGKDEPAAGIMRDVGIFTTEQFELIMTELLRSCGLPVGTDRIGKATTTLSGSLRSGVDATASRGTLGMKKGTDRMLSFATIIAFSLAEDGPKAGMGLSEVPTAGTTTPVPGGGGSGKSTTVDASAGQSTLVVPGLPAVKGTQTFLAGSRALDSVSRFVQATESFFHPSNWGLWQLRMSSFLSNLTWQVLRRIRKERKSKGKFCKTPVQYRITEAIETEFVLSLRTVCLLSMFSKDPITRSKTHGALKHMALMKPDLILPAVLERSFSSLEALETTARTTAVITALAMLAYPLVSRDNYAAGGQHLVPLLQLCIPGIDLNDPGKTMNTTIFIVMSMSTICIDDLTRPELECTPADSAGSIMDAMEVDRPAASGAEGKDQSEDGLQVISAERAEADDALRLSTSQFEDWVVQFFNRVIRVYEDLPDEGRGGRQGGKSESQIIAGLHAACDATCQALSDHMFDIAFNVVYKQCTTSTASACVKHIGHLVGCFARTNGAKVLKKLLPICADRIREELDHGASSTRTTTTSTPLESDTALHHYISVLRGTLWGVGTDMLPYKDLLISLLRDLSERCLSERAYVNVAQLYHHILAACSEIYPLDGRFANPSTWNDPKFQRGSHQWWGKLYSVKEVEVAWHTPSDEEIQFILQLLDEVVRPMMDSLEALLAKPGSERDKVWSNDFCRYVTHVRAAFEAIPGLIKLEEEGGGATVTDLAPEVAEFVKVPPRFRSGFILTDPTDPRYQKVLAFRERFGDLMLVAAKTSRGSAAEDQIDCVRQVIRSIDSYLSSYAYSHSDYRSHSQHLTFFRKISNLYAKQTTFPRKLWIRKFTVHRLSLARLNSFHRRRTAKDDELIGQILDFSLSDYVVIRKRAQALLKSIGSLYDGTRTLCMPKLLDSLKPAIEDDQMKGALHVLASRGFFRYAFDDDKRLMPYLESMLAAQYRSKPSIQKLVRSIVNGFVGSFQEIMTIDASPVPEELTVALERTRSDLGKKVDIADEALLAAVRQKVKERLDSKDDLFETLLPRVLEIIQGEKTHWAYAIFGTRMLRALTRKDRPLSKELFVFVAQTLCHENPKMRRYAQITFAKNLYYLKLRSLCKTDEDLAKQKSTNPLKRIEDLPDPLPEDWVASELASFADGELTPSTRLKDKKGRGWLVLPKQQSYYVVPMKDKDLIQWEAASQPAIDAVKEIIFKKEWWTTVFGHAAQEKDRNYLSSEITNFYKGIFQVYGIEVLQYMQEEVEKCIAERDRHKQRAAAEVISSVLRAAKHWKLEEQKQLWTWFLSLWPAILKACSPDSLGVWLMSAENIMHQRDPHRVRPLIDLIVDRARESLKKGEGDQSPWEQAKAQNFLRSVLLSLQTKFTAWTPEFVDLYCSNIGHDFQEVRAILSESLADLDLLGTPTNFPSSQAFLEACSQGRGSLLSRSALYGARLDQLAQDLSSWRAERVPAAVATSQYDRASLAALHWISTTLIDHRNSAIAGQTIQFLPEIFSMLELLDNTELSTAAKRVLNQIAVYPFTADLVGPLVRKLLDVIRTNSGSWRIRLDVLPVLQITYFRNLFYLSPEVVQEVNDLLLELLEDAHLEVREMASTTLSGIIRCSQRGMIKQLKERFTRKVKSVRLPKRDAANYPEKLIQLHGGILGVVALLSSSPYTVPEWMPELIVDTVAAHADDPVPISTTVRRSAASWKVTHQDTWHEERNKFTEEQLQEVTEWTLGRSDYFV